MGQQEGGERRENEKREGKKGTFFAPSHLLLTSDGCGVTQDT